jgi:hypothetical protein
MRDSTMDLRGSHNPFSLTESQNQSPDLTEQFDNSKIRPEPSLLESHETLIEFDGHLNKNNRRINPNQTILPPVGDTSSLKVLESESTESAIIAIIEENLKVPGKNKITTVLRILGEEILNGGTRSPEESEFKSIMSVMETIRIKESGSLLFTLQHLIECKDELINDKGSYAIICHDPVKFGLVFKDKTDPKSEWKLNLFERVCKTSDMLDGICAFTLLYLLQSTKTRSMGPNISLSVNPMIFLSNLNQSEFFLVTITRDMETSKHNTKKYVQILLAIQFSWLERKQLLAKLIDLQSDSNQKAKIIFLLWEVVPKMEGETSLMELMKENLKKLMSPDNSFREQFVGKIWKWFYREPNPLPVSFEKIENINVKKALQEWIFKAYLKSDREVIKRVFRSAEIDNPIASLLRFYFDTTKQDIETKDWLSHKNFIANLRKGDKELYCMMGVSTEDDCNPVEAILKKLAECGIVGEEEVVTEQYRSVKRGLIDEKRERQFEGLMNGPIFTRFFRGDTGDIDNEKVKLRDLNCNEQEIEDLLMMDQLLKLPFYEASLEDILNPILGISSEMNIVSKNKSARDWIDEKAKAKKKLTIQKDLKDFVKHIAKFLYNHIRVRLQNWPDWEVEELDQFQKHVGIDDRKKLEKYMDAFDQKDLGSISMKKEQWSNYILAVFGLKCLGSKLIKSIMNAYESLQGIDGKLGITDACRRELKEISEVMNQKFKLIDLKNVKARPRFETHELQMLIDSMGLIELLEKAHELKILWNTYRNVSTRIKFHDILIEGDLINYQLTFKQLKNFEEVAKFISNGKTSYNDPVDFMKQLVVHLKPKKIDLLEVLSQSKNLMDCFNKYASDHPNKESNRVVKVLKDCHIVILYDHKDTHLYEYYADLRFESAKLESYQKDRSTLKKQISNKQMYTSSELLEALVKLLISGEAHDEAPNDDNDSFLNFHYLQLMDKVRQIVKHMNTLRNRGLLLNVEDAISKSEASVWVLANSSDIALKVSNDLYGSVPLRWVINLEGFDYLINYLDGLIQSSATTKPLDSKFNFIWLMKPCHLLNLAQQISNCRQLSKEGKEIDRDELRKAITITSYYLKIQEPQSEPRNLNSRNYLNGCYKTFSNSSPKAKCHCRPTRSFRLCSRRAGYSL